MPTTSINVPNQAKTYLEPGQASTCLAVAAVLGKRFVKVTTGGLGNHPNVIPTAAVTDVVYGVSHFDAAINTDVSVLRQGTFEVTAGEAIASGDAVVGGVGGVAMKATTNRAWGVATADIANGASGPITLL